MAGTLLGRVFRVQTALVRSGYLAGVAGLVVGLAAAPAALSADGKGGPARTTAEPNRSSGSAWLAFQAGDVQRALEEFQAVTEHRPGDPMAWLGLAVTQHRLSRDDQAIASLERAIALKDGLTPGHKLLGELLSGRGDAAAAVGHLETARRQDPNDVEIQEQLAAARHMRALAAATDRLYSAHFVVHYQGPPDRRAAGSVVDRLEALYHRVGRRLGYFPTERIAVFLYPERRFRELIAGPVWAQGVFDGRIHLPVDVGAASPDSTLAHEYTHALVHRLSGGRAPAWLDEGLALLMEGAGGGRAVLARSPEELMSLTVLHGSLLDLPPRSARVAYAESVEATRCLIARYGLDRVRRLLETLPAAPAFGAAFEQVFGERYAEFDATWLAAMSRSPR
ncbi:tetratricopeptide repeat protein [Nitrospira sp. Kam-Ns4a]